VGVRGQHGRQRTNQDKYGDVVLALTEILLQRGCWSSSKPIEGSSARRDELIATKNSSCGQEATLLRWASFKPPKVPHRRLSVGCIQKLVDIGNEALATRERVLEVLRLTVSSNVPIDAPQEALSVLELVSKQRRSPWRVDEVAAWRKEEKSSGYSRWKKAQAFCKEFNEIPIDQTEPTGFSVGTCKHSSLCVIVQERLCHGEGTVFADTTAEQQEGD